MPFDALVQVKPAKVQHQDALIAIGITPVPNQVLDEHKRYMLAKVRQKRTRASWHTTPVKVTQLRRLGELYPSELTWWRSAPQAVEQLAIRVQDAIPHAQFSVGYIHKDPYLMVYYGRREACLAIWINRSRWGLVAIATQANPPATSPA